MKKEQEKTSVCVNGIGVNDCFGFGVISFFRSKKHPAGSAYLGMEEESERFEKARSKAAKSFEKLKETSTGKLSSEECEIFDIYRDLALDDDLKDEVFSLIEAGRNAEAATLFASEKIAERLMLLDDEYLRERAADIKNVANEIVEKLSDNQIKNPNIGKRNEPEKKIIVADDLSPADTVRFDGKEIAGFLLKQGSVNSHTAILASSLGIPCIVSCEGLGENFEGAFAMIDASKGKCVINPSEETVLEYTELLGEREEEKHRLLSLKTITPKTKSGKKINVFVNIGSLIELENDEIESAGGCGLFRSEFVFLEKNKSPSEEEQFEIYKKFFSKFGKKHAIIRLVDIGADKIPSYLYGVEHEENPALGVRGIRFLLQDKNIMKTQLRAIIRASVYGNAGIMIPMVTNAEEIEETRKLICEINSELERENIEHKENIPLGIMIETPASAIISRKLAKHSDFFSVGTNDLTQYTLAADRQNPSLSNLIENNLEAVFFLIEKAANAIHEKGGWIGVCGELASRTKLTERFLGIGVDELSVSLPYVLKIKDKILNLP